MASFLPLIQDLLPMIMPSAVHVVRAPEPQETRDDATATADPSLPPPPGVTQRDVIVHKSDKMCASVLVARPHRSSPIRHHGEQDTIIYAASGTGVLVVKPSIEGEAQRHDLPPGSFAFVPPWTEHQLLNETEAETTWVVVRSGPEPVAVDLTDWGGDEKKRPDLTAYPSAL